MKILIGTGTALACIAVLIATASGGISGSDHDFSSKTWNSSGQICIVCHTPHNADMNVSGAPLWNHEVTGSTFTLYSSEWLDAAPLSQPDGVSKLCLSCHDGTVAIDSFGGATGTDGPIDSGHSVGTDLSDDHPISFIYDTTLATNDGELVAPSGGEVGTGNLPLFGTNHDKLECATCHDVHNTDALGTKLLRMNNTGSALCLNCHQK